MIYRVLYIPGRWFGISSINNKQPPLELNHSIDDSSPAKVQEKHTVFKADLAGCRGITSKTLSVDHGESTRFGFRGSFTASPFGIRRAVAIRSQGGILCPKDERFEISGELFQSKSSENRTLFGGWVKCTIFGSYFTQTFDISFSISHHCQPSQCPAHCDALHQTFAAIVQWFHLDGSLRSPSSPNDNNPQVVRKTFRLN